MKFFILLLISLNIFAQSDRNISEYNLNSQGANLYHHTTGEIYDPISYFIEGGEQPKKGLPEFSLTYEGVEYLFSNAKNQETFLTAPSKFEPTYGGWCARAMVVGQKVKVDTEIYHINGNRIHFFVSKRAKRAFLRNLQKNENDADKNWKSISGEEARK